MLKLFSDMRRKIWGFDACECKIEIEWSTLQGKPVYYAVCESTLARRRLSDTNCEDVLNELFWDFCMRNADWMGVS